MTHRIEHETGRFNWFSKIDDSIVLGAIPLLSLDHVHKLPKELGNSLLIYICNFHVLSHLLLIYICKLHWNLNTMFVCQVNYL